MTYASHTRASHATSRPRPATGRSHPTATKPAHDHASAARERRARAATAPTTVHPSTFSLRPSAPTSVSSRAPRVTPALNVYSTKCLRRSTHAWPQETAVRSVAAEAPRGNTRHDDWYTRSVMHEHGTREFTCVRENMSAPRAPRLAPWSMETRQHTDSTTAGRRALPRVGARAGDDQHRGAAAFTQILVTWQRGEDVILRRGRKLVPWHCDLARAM